MLFRFLCVLWGYGSNHGDQLDVKIGAVLQTQALYMGRALLSSQPAATLEELVAADSPGKQPKCDPPENLFLVSLAALWMMMFVCKFRNQGG